MTEPGRGSTPLFSYTAYSVFTGLIVGLVLLALALVWIFPLDALSNYPSMTNGIILILVFDLVLLVVSGISILRRVWRVQFFENHLSVRGRGIKQSFAYSQIMDLHHYSVYSGFRSREIIILDMGGSTSFTIAGNPVNKGLEKDLLSWLEGKRPKGIESSRASTT